MRKIWIACTSLLLSLVLGLGVVGCKKSDPETEKATISVTVNGVAQTNDGNVSATVDTAYTVTATASNEAEVSASYKFGSVKSAFKGPTFTPGEEGAYVFTFTADGADEFKLTFNATKRDEPATQCTVTYNLGLHPADDAENITARVVVAGTEINLPAAPAAADGYTFTGWSDGANTYEAGASYTVNSTVTITAQWTAEKFGVAYSKGEHAAQDATVPAAAEHNANATIQLPAAIAAADGYIFKCWSDGSAEYNAGANYTVTGTVTITAIFVELNENTEVTVSYALGLHPAAGATVPEDDTVTVGGTVTLPAGIASESGWLFDGWSDGTATYEAGGAYTANANATLTAQWKVDPAAPVRGIVNGNFELGDLTGWTVVGGNAETLNVTDVTTYWGDNASFNDMNGEPVQKYLQEGRYFLITDGAGENQSVTVKSASFTLENDGIITFKFGIAGNPACYVALCDASTGEELIKVTNDYFADPVLAQVLLRRLIYANDYIGREVYIKLVDGADSGFGFLNFDDLKVSLTLEEAEEIIGADKEWAKTYRQDVIDSNAEMGAQTKNIINAVRGYYSALELVNVKNVYFVHAIPDKAVIAGTADITEYLSEAQGSMVGVQASTLVKSIESVSDGATAATTGFNSFALESGKSYTVTYRITDPASGKYVEGTFSITASSNNEIINGGFETGNLSGWTVLSGNIDLNGGTSSEDHNGWAEQLPFNKTGNYFCNNAGLAEHAAWELKSSTFTLGGNGFISFKMASQNAILKVYKADGTQIYSYTCHTFSDTNFPHVENGGNWCTLRTHYADLGAYKGEQLYITIGNKGAGIAWEFGYFDDIITYYAEGEDLSAKKDDVLLTCKKDGISHAAGETAKMEWIAAANEYNS